MASRQEEKEKRRQERMEAEERERAATTRRQRLQWSFGGLLALGAIAGIVIALAAAGGSSHKRATRPADLKHLPALAPQQQSDINLAAKAAGCTLENPPYEGAGHVQKEFKPSDYKTNPPTSGAHFPTWYDDGIYAPGSTPQLGRLVHTLEHGRIDVQYRQGTPPDVVRQLEAFMAEQNSGYHMLLFQNTTGMPDLVAATAWTHKLGCPAWNDKVPDALRTFRARYIDKGPESVP